MLAPKLVLL